MAPLLCDSLRLQGEEAADVVIGCWIHFGRVIRDLMLRLGDRFLRYLTRDLRSWQERERVPADAFPEGMLLELFHAILAILAMPKSSAGVSVKEALED